MTGWEALSHQESNWLALTCGAAFQPVVGAALVALDGFARYDRAHRGWSEGAVAERPFLQDGKQQLNERFSSVDMLRIKTRGNGVSGSCMVNSFVPGDNRAVRDGRDDSAQVRLAGNGRADTTHLDVHTN
jgi:hypothetical protein